MIQTIKYNNQKWNLSITRNMPFFHACMAVAGYVKDSHYFNVPKKRELYIVRQGVFAEAYFCQNDLSEYYRVIEKICSNRRLLKKLKKNYRILGNNLLKACGELEKRADLKNYDNFVKCYTALCPGLSLTSIIGRHIFENLTLELKEYYPRKSELEIEKLAGKITYPSSRTPLSGSQIKLLEIAVYIQKQKIKYKQILKDDKVKKNISLFLKKYKAVPVNFNGEAWTPNDINNQLKQLLKSNCSDDLRRLEKNHKEKIKESVILLGGIRNRIIKNFALALQTGTILNEYRKFVFCKASLAYRPLFKKLASRCRLKNWQAIWKLSSEEIRELYFFGKEEILNKLKTRKLAAVVSDQKHGFHILTGRELSDLSIHREKLNGFGQTAKPKEVKGTIGNGGLAKGTARIILTEKDFKKFKNNDVLVARMTSVDFIPLMKQAAAFVTDEGGMTSHASIVAREMDKPCVIGTKIATEVFRDGDYIEVDADKGVVRKVKK